MTNGTDLFTKRTYRQGNIHQNLHPLNDRCLNNFSQLLDENLELNIAQDYNSALGPNAFSLAEPLRDNSLFFPKQSLSETKTRPNFVFDPNSRAQKMSLLQPVYNENVPANSKFEIMKQRRKKRESKQKFNVIESNHIEGHYGEASVEEILNILEPERAKKDKVSTTEKKKKKKSGGVRKSKGTKSSDSKDLEVEVELDRDGDTPDEQPAINGENKDEQMDGIEEEETSSADLVDGVAPDLIQNECKPVLNSAEPMEPSTFVANGSVNSEKLSQPKNNVKGPELNPRKPQPIAKEPKMSKDRNQPPPERSNSIAKESKPAKEKPQPKEPQLSEQDTSKQILNRSWADFVNKYGDSVYKFIDVPSNRTSSRKNHVKRQFNGAQQDSKPVIYKNSQKPRN